MGTSSGTSSHLVCPTWISSSSWLLPFQLQREASGNGAACRQLKLKLGPAGSGGFTQPVLAVPDGCTTPQDGNTPLRLQEGVSATGAQACNPGDSSRNFPSRRPTVLLPHVHARGWGTYSDLLLSCLKNLPGNLFSLGNRVWALPLGGKCPLTVTW